jgi:hypothetical protein
VEDGVDVGQYGPGLSVVAVAEERQVDVGGVDGVDTFDDGDGQLKMACGARKPRLGL